MRNLPFKLSCLCGFLHRQGGIYLLGHPGKLSALSDPDNKPSLYTALPFRESSGRHFCGSCMRTNPRHQNSKTSTGWLHQVKLTAGVLNKFNQPYREFYCTCLSAVVYVMR